MKETKITIVTPSYNRAHTLERVYDSLKNQSFKDFKWIIMDDGSTDNTKEIVETFKAENLVEIDYFWNENSKKFYTVFEGIKKVTSEYFTILDSDDAYVNRGLEIMYNKIDALDKQVFISATFNSQFPDESLVGTLFPTYFDGSILEMRYKYKVRGDKHSIFITEKYLKYLSKFDYKIYKGKYAPQKIFFNIYDSCGEKSKFSNEKIRIYYQDENDLASMSVDRIKPSSYFGLLQGYSSFLNSYSGQLFSYPKTLFRNLVGYQTYSIKSKSKVSEIILDIKNPYIRVLGIFVLPMSYFYCLIKK